MPKVTPAEYTVFCEKYFTELLPKYPSYRFGQAFYNEFLESHEEVENLFYVTDTKRAQDIIWKHYIYTDVDYENDLKELNLPPTIGNVEIDKQFVKALKEMQ